MIYNDVGKKRWRKYQKKLKRQLKREERRISFLKRLPFLWIYICGGILTLALVAFTGSWLYAHLKGNTKNNIDASLEQTIKQVGIAQETHNRITKKDLQPLLDDLSLEQSPVTGNYKLAKEGSILDISTSIDSSLQNYIYKLLKRSQTLQAAVVVLNPATGQILAMADYDKEKQEKNLILKADIPAASLFKIVSASAAIEGRNFSIDKTFYYRGGKYTLYKSQLKKDLRKNRYTYETSLKKAFSGSNNPVFGRLGIYELGKDLLTDYADKFLFNHTIPFELPVEKSFIEVPDDDFGLAEIASGFNKRTLISPMHASLMTSAVVNNGTIMEPWVVSEIRDESGQVIYSGRNAELGSPLKKATADKIRILMEDTVKNGTCSKTFRQLRRKKSFKNIDLGAKTGTINDPNDKFKYDWVTAFAIPEAKDNGIIITVLAVHGKLLGIRAKDLAKNIINYHFTS